MSGQASFSSADRMAVLKVQSFALLLFASALIGDRSLFLKNAPQSFYLDIIQWVIFVVGAVYLRSGFRALSVLDKKNFSTAAQTTYFLIVFPLERAYLYGEYGISHYLDMVTAHLLTGEALILGFSLVFAVFIATVLGLGGLAGGTWSVGSRYGESLTKVGGLLSFIPSLWIISPVVLLVGTQRIKHKIDSKGAL